MNKYKKFTLIFLTLISITIMFHISIYNTYMKHIFRKDYHVGDLGRMSYKLDSLFPRSEENTLPNKHFDFKSWNGDSIDILTIGDSFSNGEGGGKNKFYQDYLASNYNLKVLNIPNLAPSRNYIEMVYLLSNSKLLDKLNPKIILIESVERSVIARFTGDINTNININQNIIISNLKKAKWVDGTPKSIPIINDINIKAFIYNIAYKYDDNAFRAKCYISKLNKNLFSSQDSNTLLFYKNDILYNTSITKNRIKKLNVNFNNLAIMLKEKNIKLYFMPAVNKLTLYSKYLIKNSYVKSTFFEQLRNMKKEYTFVDTKAILEKEINNGIKDVFYSDDTHWSYKASDAISKSLKEFEELNR